MSFHPEYKENTHKGKRTKHKTDCSVLRRQYGCGICGSENIAAQGVKYCEICGTEKDFLVEANPWTWFWGNDITLPCKCMKSWIGLNGKERKCRATQIIVTMKCLDCGAVKSNYCPNCNGSTCWKSWNGKMFCKKCGFRK